MQTAETQTALAGLFRELTAGAPRGAAFILNGGDDGLLRALDALSAEDASRSLSGGATVAAHAAHLAYGLSLMNRWAEEGGNPFADADWGEAWKTSTVDDARWQEIRRALADEVRRWGAALETPREMQAIELSGMIASVAHLAYHLGAIRQIAPRARGPKDGASG